MRPNNFSAKPMQAFNLCKKWKDQHGRTDWVHTEWEQWAALVPLEIDFPPFSEWAKSAGASGKKKKEKGRRETWVNTIVLLSPPRLLSLTREDWVRLHGWQTPILYRRRSPYINSDLGLYGCHPLSRFHYIGDGAITVLLDSLIKSPLSIRNSIPAPTAFQHERSEAAWCHPEWGNKSNYIHLSHSLPPTVHHCSAL